MNIADPISTIFVTATQPQELVKGLEKHNSYAMFGPRGRPYLIDQFIAASRPVKVWYNVYGYSFARVLVIVDGTRLQGVSRGQLADYIAMVGFAEIKPDADLDDTPTILRLFDGGLRATPEGLTEWDQAFLRSLNSTVGTLETRIGQDGSACIEHDQPNRSLRSCEAQRIHRFAAKSRRRFPQTLRRGVAVREARLCGLLRVRRQDFRHANLVSRLRSWPHAQVSPQLQARRRSGNARKIVSRYAAPECRHTPLFKVNAKVPCPTVSTKEIADILSSNLRSIRTNPAQHNTASSRLMDSRAMYSTLST